MKISLYNFFIFISFTINAQTERIDKLISKIENRQITVVEKDNPKMKSRAGNKIIKMGKEVTPTIISLLNDSKKGIIAHFILCEIWKDNVGFGSSSCGVIDSKKNIVVTYFFYKNLRIEVNSNNTIFATNESLINNKKMWQELTN